MGDRVGLFGRVIQALFILHHELYMQNNRVPPNLNIGSTTRQAKDVRSSLSTIIWNDVKTYSDAECDCGDAVSTSRNGCRAFTWWSSKAKARGIDVESIACLFIQHLAEVAFTGDGFGIVWAVVDVAVGRARAIAARTLSRRFSFAANFLA